METDYIEIDLNDGQPEMERQGFFVNRIDCMMCLGVILGAVLLVGILVWFLVVHV